MSILDMASGQNMIGGQDPSMVGGNPAAPVTGWGSDGRDNSSSFGSILYGPTPGTSVPADQGVDALTGVAPQVETPQHYEQAPPQAIAPQAPPPNGDLEAMAWHNQGLLRHIQELENRVAQIKPLENLLRYDPTAYERIVNAVYQPLQPQSGPPAAAPQTPEEAPPAFPWEQQQQAAQTQQYGVDPRQLAQMNALMLTEAMTPVKQELEQTKVELAKIHLERQINDLRGRYGDSFNPKEVVAYAYSNGIADLDRAFRGVLGERTYRQQFQAQPQQQFAAPTPGPAQVGGYASAQTPPPAAVPAAPEARVEPTRARSGAPQSSAFPQNFRPRDPHEAANYALHLLREMKQRP